MKWLDGLKVVKTITGNGLKESKDLVDQAPSIIAEGVTYDAAKDYEKQLVDAGATVQLKAN